MSNKHFILKENSQSVEKNLIQKYLVILEVTEGLDLDIVIGAIDFTMLRFNKECAVLLFCIYVD